MAAIVLVVFSALTLCVSATAANSNPTAVPDPVPGQQPAAVVSNVAESEAHLIEIFAHAYRTRDFDLYRTVFANEDEHGVPYTFFLVGRTNGGDEQWGYDEEMRIHRRMFAPETLPPGEQLQRSLWVREIFLELRPQRAFKERYDLYRSDAHVNGLDRKRWRATDAEYSTHLEVRTRGAGTMRVLGIANFVVIEDLHKRIGDEDKFLIYHWVDECRSHNASQRASN